MPNGIGSRIKTGSCQTGQLPGRIKSELCDKSGLRIDLIARLLSLSRLYSGILHSLSLSLVCMYIYIYISFSCLPGWPTHYLGETNRDPILENYPHGQKDRSGLNESFGIPGLLRHCHARVPGLFCNSRDVKFRGFSGPLAVRAFFFKAALRHYVRRWGGFFWCFLASGLPGVGFRDSGKNQDLRDPGASFRYCGT